MIFQLIYRSTATRHLYPAELNDLLAVSRRKNGAREISGMLLYDGGKFLQLLEGEEGTVRETFETISRDARHKWVSLVMTGPQGERDFADWSMAFRDLSEESPPEGWNAFLNGEEVPPDVAKTSQMVRDLFVSFRHAL